MKGIVRALDLLALLALAAIVSIVLSGGYEIDLGRFAVSLRNLRNPSSLLAAAVLLRLLAGGLLKVTFPAAPRSRLAAEALAWLLVAGSYAAYLRWLGEGDRPDRFFLAFLGCWFLKLILRCFGRGIGISAERLRLGPLIAVFSACYFLAVYWDSPHSPRSSDYRGFWMGYDQGWYLKMAEDLSAGRLEPDRYMYGIGYPLLGVPFFRLYPLNPFLIPNLILYSSSLWLYFSIARRLLPPPLALLVPLFLSFGVPFVEYFAVPWNNAVAVFVLALVAWYGFREERLRYPEALLIGLALGWLFSARYVDVVFVLPAAVTVLARAGSGDRGRPLKILASALGAFLAAALLVLLTHYAAFGSLSKTPYHRHGGPEDSDQTPQAYRPGDIPGHLFATLINPYRFDRMPHDPLFRPLLERSFLFALSPLGFLGLLKTTSRFRRRLLGALGAAALASALFYGSFRSTKALDLQYGCLRYFMMWYPLLAIFALHPWSGGRSRTGLLLCAAVGVAGCATVPPDNVENICDIFRERPSWYEIAKDASARWKVPVPVLMAIIHQESRFDGTAYPPRTTFLGFIPGPRPSTAYGYAQALSETWEIYVRETGNAGADRDDFEDAIDFVGWFCHRSYLRCRIPKTDAYRLYLAHHEGQDGYNRRSYAGKPWLTAVAGKVQRRCALYARQLRSCRKELENL